MDEYMVGLGYFIDSLGRIWFKVRETEVACRIACGRAAEAYDCLGWW